MPFWFFAATAEYGLWSAKVKTYQPGFIDFAYAPAPGVASEYLRLSCGAKYGFTVETGNPSNLSQASILDWGATQIKVLVDLFNEGKF